MYTQCQQQYYACHTPHCLVANYATFNQCVDSAEQALQTVTWNTRPAINRASALLGSQQLSAKSGTSKKVSLSATQLDLPTSHPPVTTGFQPPILNSCVKPGQFALTFDDGPAPNSVDLLQVLKQKNAIATFFVNAHNQADLINDPKSKERLSNLHAAGMEIGSHTYSHANMSQISVESMWSELSRNDQVIFSAIGVRPRFVRLPYLASNPQVISALGSWGYRIAGVNIDILDYVHSGTANEVQQNIDLLNSQMATVQATSYISLSHDFTARVAETTSLLIDIVRSKRFAFVGIAECFGETNAYRNDTKVVKRSSITPRVTSLTFTITFSFFGAAMLLLLFYI